MTPPKLVLPGQTVGMLGGGQLGRMSILAGRRMGYRFQVLESKPGCPASMVADDQIVGAYDDRKALDELAKRSDVVTLEFENIPSSAIDYLNQQVAVYPSSRALHICQNRRREKTFLQEAGFPCAPFSVVSSAAELAEAVNSLGAPVVLKTADFGYDGKGQVKLNGREDLNTVWDDFGSELGVVEKWITFEGEYSAICSRNANGDTSVFPVARNIHRNHILHKTVVPSGLSSEQEQEARNLAENIARELDVVGLIAVELFLTADGWLVNEMAPRPHNSGHYSFDACLTSQFEQHIRAVCNLPLGDPKLITPVVMINLLGDLWGDKAPPWARLLEDPGLKLHLYGKSEAKPGRKMGHYCILGDDINDVETRADRIFESLSR